MVQIVVQLKEDPVASFFGDLVNSNGNQRSEIRVSESICIKVRMHSLPALSSLQAISACFSYLIAKIRQ